MNQKRFAPVSLLASAVAGICTAMVDALWNLITVDTRHYRPERYFMRGPGPAWRAKHARDGESAL